VFIGNCGRAWDFLRQNSRNSLSLHRVTVSGLTRISSDLQSLQTFESNDQNRRSLFLSRGFFDLRLYTASCSRNARIRTQATRLRLAKTTRFRDCKTTIMSRIFMPAGWISGTRKSNEIGQDGVFADHGYFVSSSWITY
jgi:hypothetical protein